MLRKQKLHLCLSWLRFHWSRSDTILFIVCPMVFSVVSVLDWFFGLFGSGNPGDFVIGGTEG